MLGSTSEADDAVQEAWLRLSRSNAGEIDNLEAWLVTAVGRVALNMLRSRRTRREEPLGAHLPDPVVDRADGIDPEHEALLADSVGLALLVVLETLTPAERLAYVLHDMFSVPFDEIGAILDLLPDAARQLASRGRRRIGGANTTPDADPAAQQESRRSLPRRRARRRLRRPHRRARSPHRAPRRHGQRDPLEVRGARTSPAERGPSRSWASSCGPRCELVDTRGLVELLISRLCDGYVFPGRAARPAELVRSRFEQGPYVCASSQDLPTSA